MAESETQVAVLGLGLMGSSLCLALRKLDFPGRLVGCARRLETREQALERGMVDAAYATMSEAMQGTSFAVVCTPVQHLAGMARICLDAAEAGAVITDVGSTKGALMEAVRGVASEGSFVGSHPMCGSEQTGIDAGTADLYRGATVAVVAGDAPADAVKRTKAFWSLVGGVPVALDAREHDQLVASTSHLPHLVAALLVAAVARDGADDELRRFVATGFRDTTRVADGSAEMWRGILDSNRPAIAAELAAFRDEVTTWLELLQAGDTESLENHLRDCAALRKALLQTPKS